MNTIMNKGLNVHINSIHAGMACLRKLLRGCVARPAPACTAANARPVREATIDDLGLTPRVIQVLEREEILTVEDLVRKTPQQLLSLRGIGQQTLKKIDRALAFRGACLRSEYA